MANVRLGGQYLNAIRFVALLNHERASKTVYEGNSRATVYRV